MLTGRTAKRREGKRADYLLRYRHDLTLAVVEAKPYKATAGDGLQQAKDYAEILGLKFAYATNGREIIEFDFLIHSVSLVCFPRLRGDGPRCVVFNLDWLWLLVRRSAQAPPHRTRRTPCLSRLGRPAPQRGALGKAHDELRLERFGFLRL